MEEAFDFYEFIKSVGSLDKFGSGRFLDFGCGWGRISRPFMRDFDLDKIYGFEPNGLFTLIARSLNPYVTFLSGGYEPDGSLPAAYFDLVAGWSVFSHLPGQSLRSWLREMARVIRPAGIGVFTTWGMRFLQRLRVEQQQMAEGKEIHWYSKKCVEAAGDIEARISEVQRGEFVWFSDTESEMYGEAFLPEQYLRRVLEEERLPLEIRKFDTESLYQDVFVLERVPTRN